MRALAKKRGCVTSDTERARGPPYPVRYPAWVVARILGTFVDKGLVATRRGRVEVLDRPGLARLSGAAA